MHITFPVVSYVSDNNQNTTVHVNILGVWDLMFTSRRLWSQGLKVSKEKIK